MFHVERSSSERSERDVRLTAFQDLADIPHFAFDFKQGGWENRLIAVFGRLLGPRLGRDD